jgi:hypothetical protein
MKHAYAPKSNNVGIFIVMGLIHLFMINNSKQGVGFEYKLGLFRIYDAFRSRLKVLIENK